MKYMGSKNRIAKYILPIILKYRDYEQWYVEPFVGGCNIIDKVTCNRLAGDTNEYLVAMWQAIQDGWTPPDFVTEQEYRNVRNNKDMFRQSLVGFVGFGCSYSGKWFGGYARGNNSKGAPRNYAAESYRNIVRQANSLKGVVFVHCAYDKLPLPPKSLIYCDPPYANTTKYKNKFNHADFWEWCRDKAKEGHTVFVSEYTAPDDFTCVWSKEIISSLTQNTGAKRGIERLFNLTPNTK